MAHGTTDVAVWHAWGASSRDLLQAAGWQVEWHEYSTGHGSTLEEIEAFVRFIERVLGA
jgi:phospholipase/carboxylesterase